MERCLSVLVIIAVVIVVKAVRAAKSSGLDLPVALDRSLAEVFPAGVARYVRQDLMLLRAIFMLITGRRDVADDQHAIAYSGPLVLMLSVVTVGDGVVAVLLHQLLPSGVREVGCSGAGSDRSGVVGGLRGFADCYPHVVSADRLRLRFSAFHDILIPAAASSSVSTTSLSPRTQKSAARFGDQLEMAVTGQAKGVLDLEATSCTSLNPRISDTGTLTRVSFYADKPTQARRLLAAISTR